MSKPVISPDIEKFNETLETVINLILKEEQQEKHETTVATHGTFDILDKYMNYSLLFILILGLTALWITFFKELDDFSSSSITK